jgi:hypothetical protein
MGYDEIHDADYLVIGGEQVFHILGPGKVAMASPTPGARPGPRDTVTYPPQVAEVPWSHRS